MKPTLICSGALLVAIAFFSARGFAQTTQPSSANSEVHLKATVTGVDGIVQVRLADDQPWQKPTVGMEVGENAEFRTGPKSAVRFTIPPDQTVTLDRLGSVKVLQAISENGKLVTNLGMKYGRTRYDIEAGGRQHESTITSPSSTLAVRGTKVSLYDQRPFPAVATSLTGRAEFRDFRKHVFFGNKNAGTTVVNVQNPTAAGVALGQTVVDPSVVLARTQAENSIVASLLSRGATISFDYERGIRVVTGGTVPLTDSELIPTLPGVLDFVLRWSGNADLNLGVVEPGNGPGHTIYPQAGSDHSVGGGTTAFDHRGGPNGGIEVVFYPTTPPDGRYFIGVQHMSGPNVPATMDVFRNGQRVPITLGQQTVNTFSFIAAPVNPSLDISGMAAGTIDVVPQNVKTQSVAQNKAVSAKPFTFVGPMPQSAKKPKH